MEKRCVKFVVENLCAMSLQFQSRKFVEFLGFVRPAGSFGDLSAKDIAGQEEWRLLLAGNRGDLIGIILRLAQLTHLQRNPAKQYQRLQFGKGRIQLAKMFQRLQCEWAGLPNASQRK